jgi:murein L,D-transpeptidase YcbB/YkuD
MKTSLIPLVFLLFGTAGSPDDQSQMHWSAAQLAVLQTWLNDAPNEALTISNDADLANSIKVGDTGQIDAAANVAAIALARAHLFGCTAAKDRSGWQIGRDDDEIDLSAWLRDALRRNNLDGFYRSMRPQHADYEKLRIAYRSEKDAAKKLTLARNMERWRWMPLNLGSRYLLVNAASYEVGLWSGGKKAGDGRHF